MAGPPSLHGDLDELVEQRVVERRERACGRVREACDGALQALVVRVEPAALVHVPVRRAPSGRPGELGLAVGVRRGDRGVGAVAKLRRGGRGGASFALLRREPGGSLLLLLLEESAQRVEVRQEAREGPLRLGGRAALGAVPRSGRGLVGCHHTKAEAGARRARVERPRPSGMPGWGRRVRTLKKSTPGAGGGGAHACQKNELRARVGAARAHAEKTGAGRARARSGRGCSPAPAPTKQALARVVPVLPANA